MFASHDPNAISNPHYSDYRSARLYTASSFAQSLTRTQISASHLEDLVTMSITSLNDAMSTPALRTACCLVLDDPSHGAGYGLKQCRLINRGLREEMLSHVSNYHLCLDGYNAPTLEAARFLRGTRLVSLRVHVEIMHAPNTFDSYSSLPKHDVLKDLIIFMAESAPAFSTVQHLHFVSVVHDPFRSASPFQGPDFSASHNECLLQILCGSMPGLSSLTVDGCVDLEICSSIGVACPGLVKLVLEPSHHHWAALEKLSHIFPAVSSLGFHMWTECSEAQHHLNLMVALSVLEQSPVITHLDLGAHSSNLDNRIWQRLPPNLQSLLTSSTHRPQYGLSGGALEDNWDVLYMCLQSVEWDCCMEDATSLFRRAPNLVSLVSNMDFLCNSDSTGLLLWKEYQDIIMSRPGLSVSGELVLFDNDTCDIGEFLARAIPAVRTACVYVLADTQMRSDGVVHLSRVFPMLSALTIGGDFCTDEELPELRLCEHLIHLSFHNNDIISDAGVMLAVCLFPALRIIEVHSCGRMEREFIACMLVKYGLAVKLGAQIS